MQNLIRHSKPPVLFFLKPQPHNHTTDPNSYISLIKQCTSLKPLKTLHAITLKIHLILHNPYVLTSLIAHYSSLRSIYHAHTLFKHSHPHDVFLWNTMISGLVDNEMYNLAIELYKEMRTKGKMGIFPDNYTFPVVIKACWCFGDFKMGEIVHRDVLGFGYESDVYVRNSLIKMYAEFGRVQFSWQVFDKMPERNAISWGSMIGACAQNGCFEDGLRLFWRMLEERIVVPHKAIFLNVLECVHRERDADYIYQVVVENGLDSELSVMNSVMLAYARCGRIDVARRFFDGVNDRDLVSWASMIESYIKVDSPLEALKLFKDMLSKQVIPDSITFLNVTQACSHLGSLVQAQTIHAMIIRNFADNRMVLDTSIVDLYVKCGNIMYARKIFDRMHEKNLISWSTMISGYGIHGYGRDALYLFDQMKASIKPDHIVFIAILSACSHAGLESEGWECFNSMNRDFGVVPRHEHYACMVDLLGRAGRLAEVEDFIEKMPIAPNASVWGSLLGACRIHKNIVLAEKAAKSLFELESNNAGRYVLLSNIYASSGRKKEAESIRNLMRDRGVKKASGHTIIEIKNKVYTFVAGDRSHPQTEMIYSELEKVMNRIRQEGYKPDLNFVLHDLEEEMKETALYSHSEKLAIVFGLINLDQGSVIRIRKNLRVCADCHTAIKYISKVTGREIVMRDLRRFHHFRNGVCSCGDYW